MTFYPHQFQQISPTLEALNALVIHENTFSDSGIVPVAVPLVLGDGSHQLIGYAVFDGDSYAFTPVGSDEAKRARVYLETILEGKGGSFSENLSNDFLTKETP